MPEAAIVIGRGDSNGVIPSWTFQAIDWLNDLDRPGAIWLVLVAALISAGNAFSRYGFS